MLVGGCKGRERGDAKTCFSAGIYSIQSLFQEHSPGGATVLLCLICYVVCRTVGWRSG